MPCGSSWLVGLFFFGFGLSLFPCGLAFLSLVALIMRSYEVQLADDALTAICQRLLRADRNSPLTM
jgi:hypothetical protein